MAVRVILFVLFINTFNYSQVADTTEIINNLNKFVQFSIDRNGEDAINYLDSASFKYYTKIYNDALYSNKDEINKLSLTTRYYVLILRAYYNSKDLIGLDTRTFISKLIKDGIIGSRALPKIDYQYSINGNNAKLYFNKTDTTYYFEFNKENNMWKLNISSLMRLGNIQFEEQIRLGILTEKEINEKLREFFTTLLNTDSVDYLWAPLVK